MDQITTIFMHEHKCEKSSAIWWTFVAAPMYEMQQRTGNAQGHARYDYILEDERYMQPYGDYHTTPVQLECKNKVVFYYLLYSEQPY